MSIGLTSGFRVTTWVGFFQNQIRPFLARHDHAINTHGQSGNVMAWCADIFHLAKTCHIELFLMARDRYVST